MTGSRRWENYQTIYNILESLWREFRRMAYSQDYPIGRFTVVEGGCATGADLWARDWVRLHSIRTWHDQVASETFAANWTVNGLQAGPMRNSAMVASGVDLCLAFMRPNSRGTMDCVTKAIKAGIPTHIFHETEEVDWRLPANTPALRSAS
ncbi:hypothetical protein [Kitasatospora sp. NPDC056800]|uniref:hypothetical protein n=1 Tax=Kitasatospora sp. NPDC056800 TaxID=3345948 RepID=UPI0036A2A24C